MQPRKGFPKEIIVTREIPANDDPYLVIWDGAPDVTETTAAATYRLVEVGKIIVSHEFKKLK